MYLSSESIIVILFVGLVAGWLAGKIVRGTGFGIIGDIVVGIVGALISTLLFPRLGHHPLVDRAAGSDRRSALAGAGDGIHDPSPQRADPTVARVLGAGD
jgi:uncharacterized membrane protein YeaQ/YmgE (transglycosylase-associated protein family)